MAYVTVEWEYGDTSTIEGFRIYRDGVLRQEVASNIRTINDSVDDTTESRVKYEVKAYDSAQRESYGCQYSEVLLLSRMTPIMTSQTTPSGNAYSFYSGGENDITVGWQAFDGDASTKIKVRWPYHTADVKLGINVVYEFSEATRVLAWGFKQCYTASLNCEELQLFGSNDGSNWSPIDTMSYEKGLADGTEMTQTLSDAVYYSQYKFLAEGTCDQVAYTAGESLFSELYLYNRDEAE